MPVGKDSILRAANSTVHTEKAKDSVTAKVTNPKLAPLPEEKVVLKKKKEELPFYLL